MKILVISDLHLCDIRHKNISDGIRLEKLAKFIASFDADAVLNLGDTVSRKPLLTESCLEDGFKMYLAWRNKLDVPFFECAIGREFSFFENLMGVPPDLLTELSDNAAIITMAPQADNDHSFLPGQLEFLTDALNRCREKTVVIGTHIPFPGSCSREDKPGTFLEIPADFKKFLVSFPGRIIWCGGHFHWYQEQPATTGSLTALYASRFQLADEGSYSSIIDTGSGNINFINLDF